MRSVFFWEAGGLSLTRANPYGGLLAQGLAGVGVELVAGHAHELTEAWLLENRGRVNVLHLNWPHYMYDSPDLPEHVRRCTDFISRLAQARFLGYKVVWTVHNLYPHNSHFMPLDRLARLAITHIASAVIVHCGYARQRVREQFYRAEGVFQIPHGHFIDVYPNTITRAEARRQLGIADDKFVYLAVGNVSPYKGLEQLIEVFAALPDDDAVLLWAAKIHNEYGEELVAKSAQADPRIVVRPSRFYANEEFQLFFNAADTVVFPFVEVLTSGSVITALSFGRPVIVPGIGCLSELVDETMGVLYDPRAPDGLAGAMRAARGRDLTACGAAAMRKAQALSWDGIARQTLAAYRHGDTRTTTG